MPAQLYGNKDARCTRLLFAAPQEQVSRLQQDAERMACTLRDLSSQAQASEAHVVDVLRDKDALRAALEEQGRKAAQQMVSKDNNDMLG